MVSRRVALGFVLGVLVGVVVGVGIPTPGAASTPVSTPTLSTASATGCVEGGVEAGGWVGQMPAGGNARTVAVNYTVPHDAADVNVSGSLTRQGQTGDYVLALTTTPVADSAKGDPPENCQPRTKMEAVAALPNDFETLTVVVNDETVTEVRNSESSASFRVLNATA